ncbi:MAG: CPBP family intramembrane metalloprotease [Candidatus Liptonbacteria bacterium]|nr:CPBP family intramembrane metalloprotease [Candidatus Liptonbacteria bacterium]
MLFVDTAIAIALVAILCLLIGKNFREKLVAAASEWPPQWVFLWTSAIMLAVICTIPFTTSPSSDAKMFRIVLYFLAPALVLSLKRWCGWGDAADIFAIFLIAVPAAIRLIPAWSDTAVRAGIPIAYWGMTIYLLAAFPTQNKLEINSAWKLGREDVKTIFTVFTILFVCIVPAGIALSFIYPGLQQFHKYPLWSAPLIFFGIFITIAIPEEVICRIYMQGLFSKKFGVLTGIILTSIAFGFGHITRITKSGDFVFGFPNWRYVLFATIAGIGYGYVYHKRKSLVACAALHALVDFTWGMFFSG